MTLGELYTLGTMPAENFVLWDSDNYEEQQMDYNKIYPHFHRNVIRWKPVVIPSYHGMTRIVKIVVDLEGEEK